MGWSVGTVAWLWIPGTLVIVVGLWQLGLWGAASAKYKRNLNYADYVGCRIAFFRPFDTRYAKWARNLIIPFLKGYGRVVHLNDESFEQSDYQGVLSGPYEKLADDVISQKGRLSQVEREMIEMAEQMGDDMIGGWSFDDLNWQDYVLYLLPSIDIAVVDVSTVSDNLLWELRQCLYHLPPERVILIANWTARKKVTGRSDAINAALSDSGVREIQTVLIYHPTNAHKFAEAIHERMVTISRAL
jgi:hypothetical protein